MGNRTQFSKIDIACFLSFVFIFSQSVIPPISAIAKDTKYAWQKQEITLTAKNSYPNPYTDVIVWVDLKGPDFNKRCYGFWDGDKTFRVQITATTPGKWNWTSGSNQRDSGLNGKKGNFTAKEPTQQMKETNPNWRGMVIPTPNGHALQYADGSPFFLLADTWWPCSTFRFYWYDDDSSRPLGPDAGFKDYLQYRKKQGFNGIAMIAALPSWGTDSRPAKLETPERITLRAAWKLAGTDLAKEMHDEQGNRPFLFPGKAKGYENVFPDLDRINPAYFQSLDKKIDYLNAQGFIPFIEVTRRDIGQGWKKYHQWPDSYTRFIQYIWSRYQANICIFSPIHLDSPSGSIPADDWNLAANKVIETFGHPPFGTLASCNAPGTSLDVFDHRTNSKWITMHQIGNRRTHDCYELLTKIFNAVPPLPALNGEPYYDGMPDANGGTERAALYCRSGMYGSVLSGGLAGHIYAAGGWKGGIWDGSIEPGAPELIWNVMKYPSADNMQHLKTFILSEGTKYRDLVPATELLKPNKSAPPNKCVGWAYCAKTPDKKLFVLYFEKDCPQATLSGLAPQSQYKAQWFDTRTGQWLSPEKPKLETDSAGEVKLPSFPQNEQTSTNDWAMKLNLLE